MNRLSKSSFFPAITALLLAAALRLGAHGHVQERIEAVTGQILADQSNPELGLQRADLVQTGTNLTVWSPLLMNYSTNPAFTFPASATNDDRRFFRVRRP